ncbi:MAG: SDR family oxidoreductase [Myxococcota bacterium]|nr:SDR family oxidoreductase [Myxococcota bacterium]
MGSSASSASIAPDASKLSPELLAQHSLITGFPGFIAARLVRQLLDLTPAEHRFVFLVLPSMTHIARERLDAITQEDDRLDGRWEIVEGDITEPNLGFDQETYTRLTESIGIVWHLAAIYDLAVAEQIAYKVNVTGTIHVLDFCLACKNFKRHNYISTCYVSGDRTGMIYERELDMRQGHKNHYEETKFWAEVEVQRRWQDIPTAIFRPGIVIGDSRTGETDKYDGPYYIFKLLHRLPAWLPLPNIGAGTSVVNLVPVDFVVDAMTRIGLTENADQRVYQLADPNPMTAGDIQALALKLLDRPEPKGAIPASLVDNVMRAERVEELLGVPRESVIYFNHDARYDSTNTQRALRETSIRCPHLSTYLIHLIDYFLRNPEKGFLDNRKL